MQGNVDRRQNRRDGVVVDTGAGEGAVEVDHMQPGAAGPRESHRLGRRVVVENRRLVHVTAQQADTLAGFEVNRRKQDHHKSL